MPLDLSFQKKMFWAWTFARRLKTWEWINGSFKPGAPKHFQRMMDTGRYFLDGGEPPTRMNCWEAVLISGILAGIYTREGVVAALSMKKGTQNNRLMWYMYTNPELIVEMGAPVPGQIPLGSILMFGRNGEHFAYSLGGELLTNLDKSQKGTKTITWLRANGYQGETFWPLYVKRPPDLPADVS
jgi:hypothetical protein